MVEKKSVQEILTTVIDPEIMMDIWSMGLVYDIKITGKKKNDVHILMTLTTPMCPYGPMLIEEVKQKVGTIAENVEVELTFDPPWKPSDDLRMQFGV